MNKMSENKESDVKHVNIADIVGEWGKWQFHLFIYVFTLNAVTTLNGMGYAFHAYDNDFYCSDVPKDYPNKTKDMKCFQFSNPNQTCNDWQYDRTEFQTSIKTEFDLVCHRSYFGPISQTCYMLAHGVSGMIFAHYSDKNGRRPMIWIAFIIQWIGILYSALSFNIYLYTVSQILVGIGTSGIGMGFSIIMVECCGPKYRADISIMREIGAVIGFALIPGLAYWLQNFRYMQLISLFPMSLMMVWYYFLYESPRWQITNGQVDKAEITLRKALNMNGKSDNNLKTQLTQLSNYLQKVQSDGETIKTHSILDLLRTPNLRKITMIMWYTWAVNSLIHYSFSVNMSDFGGNLYITFLLSGLVEIPSLLLSALLLRYIGRRKLCSMFMVLTAVSCFAVIPSRSVWLKVTFALLGKFAVKCSWNVMTIHGPELYPTVIRQTGLGASSVFRRMGSIAALFMKGATAQYGLGYVMLFYGTLICIGAIIVLFLPETKGYEIQDTIEEAENRDKRMKTMKSELNGR